MFFFFFKGVALQGVQRASTFILLCCHSSPVGVSVALLVFIKNQVYYVVIRAKSVAEDDAKYALRRKT